MSATEPTGLAALNAMDDDTFVQTLGCIFEHSPWVAAAVLPARPFASVEALHGAMVAAMRAAAPERQLALIRAHPELAGQAARAGGLTAASSEEQASAGLDACSAQELATIATLNERYARRFGFPFIMAVKGKSRGAILSAYGARVGNSAPVEFDTALAEIARIARLRLDATIS